MPHNQRSLIKASLSMDVNSIFSLSLRLKHPKLIFDVYLAGRFCLRVLGSTPIYQLLSVLTHIGQTPNKTYAFSAFFRTGL